MGCNRPGNTENERMWDPDRKHVFADDEQKLNPEPRGRLRICRARSNTTAVDEVPHRNCRGVVERLRVRMVSGYPNTILPAVKDYL